MVFGDRLKNELRDRDMSLAHLRALMRARGTPIGQQALELIIKRPQEKSTKASAIADALGLSVRWLLTGEGAREAGSAPNADYAALVDQFDRSLATLMAPGPAREWSEKLVAIVRNWLEPSQSDPATVRIRPPKGPAGSLEAPQPRPANKAPAPR
jgi:hypothetical protein